jgi:multidrug efflux pump subunit AcrA (membrane-fusion protein)
MQIDLKTSKRSANIKITMTVLVLLLMVILLYLTINPSMPKLNKADLNTVVVQQGDIDIFIPVYGEYISEYERLITSPSAGQITEVFIRTGADVTKTTIIAKMSNPDLQQELYESQVKLERMKSEYLSFDFAKQNEQLAFQSDLADIDSQIQTTKLDVDVNTRLVDQGITGAIELERAMLAYKQIQKRSEFAEFRFEKLLEMHKLQLQQQKILLAQQEQHVKRIETKIQQLNITAGIDGTLQRLDIEVGQRLTRGAQIGKVGSKEKLIAQINIPQRMAPHVIAGATLNIISKTSEIKGHITQMGSVVENGFVVAEAAITSELPKTIKPSQPLNAELFITHKKQALFVEQKPGLIPLSQMSIFTQTNNNPTLEKTTINFGELSNHQLLISSGAKKGDVLVVNDMKLWDTYNQLALEAP